MSDFEVCPVGTVARLAQVEAERDALRMQLVACGVVALANTPESAANAREMHPDYRSPSCDDVARAVDREMALRAERDALFQIIEAIEMALRMGIPAFEVLRASSSIRGEMQSVIAKVKGGGNG